MYLRHLPCLFITECFLNFGSNLNSIHLDSFICSQFLKSSLLQFLTNISIIILIAAPPFKLNCCLALQSSFPASTSLLVLENYVFVAERQKDERKKTERQKHKSAVIVSGLNLAQPRKKSSWQQWRGQLLWRKLWLWWWQIATGNDHYHSDDIHKKCVFVKTVK